MIYGCQSIVQSKGPWSCAVQSFGSYTCSVQCRLYKVEGARFVRQVWSSSTVAPLRQARGPSRWAIRTGWTSRQAKCCRSGPSPSSHWRRAWWKCARSTQSRMHRQRRSLAGALRTGRRKDWGESVSRVMGGQCGEARTRRSLQG